MKSTAPNINPELLHPHPPLPHIKEFGGLLCDEMVQASVLDLGCGTGRNARFLAGLGHVVIGITNDFEEALAAKHLSRGYNCNYVVGDIRELPFRSRFQVVLANEVLHMMPKYDSRNVLETARAVTTSKGLHVVTGYLADHHSVDIRNQQHCFKPGELRHSYEAAGWRVLSYDEVHQRPTYFDNQELLNSRVAIIARKP
ncbi:MAG TPA: class I SAM-dependent methyltransferase [Candidatus Saccharimonadales bacterium]|nr:class I SAM-dependent methyltransferase [Candidatus Saccharimonadales bacterium]